MKKWWGIGLSAILLISSYFVYCLIRPVSFNKPRLTVVLPDRQDLLFSEREANIGAVGYWDSKGNAANCRILNQDKNQSLIRPTASLAKLITAQVVLAQKPMQQASDGDWLTMSLADEQRYQNEVHRNGSSVLVYSGQVVSQKQMLQGVLLASANNMADSLAIWAFGSMDNYRQAAQQWLSAHNLNHTTIGVDASGFDKSTTSTALDLCQIALLASQNPILVDIMSQPIATMPSGQVIKNTNKLLGNKGVFAGKTGYTEEAGAGVILLGRTAKSPIMAAISLANNNYQESFTNASRMLQTSLNNIRSTQFKAGQTVGQLTGSWGQSTSIISGQSIRVYYWSDQPPTSKLIIDNKTNLSQNSVIGRLQIGGSQVNLLVGDEVKSPTIGWRLLHPIN